MPAVLAAGVTIAFVQLVARNALDAALGDAWVALPVIVGILVGVFIRRRLRDQVIFHRPMRTG